MISCKFQWSFKQFSMEFKSVSRHFMEISRVFHGSFKGVSTKFQENLNKFQSFKKLIILLDFFVAWHSSQLPKQKGGLFYWLRVSYSGGVVWWDGLVRWFCD